MLMTTLMIVLKTLGVTLVTVLLSPRVLKKAMIAVLAYGDKKIENEDISKVIQEVEKQIEASPDSPPEEKK